MRKVVSMAAVGFLLSACSITQNIEPAEISRGAELCIIENPKVREGFLKEYRSVLSSKGIPNRLVGERSVPSSCEWTSTYVARWSWDLTIYMAYAEIKILHDGKLAGVAEYDSTKGGANMGKFIDAEPKIRELVEELLQVKSGSLNSMQPQAHQSAGLSGDSLYQAEKLSEEAGCVIEDKLKDEAETEVYSANCQGGDDLFVRCEWGNCKRFEP